MLTEIREISVQALKQAIDNKEDIHILDVREAAEIQAANIGGQFIPVGQVVIRQSEIDQTKKTAVLCRSGRRSAMAIMQLQALGYENLYNVQGGILAWAAEIDNTLKP